MNDFCLIVLIIWLSLSIKSSLFLSIWFNSRDESSLICDDVSLLSLPKIESKILTNISWFIGVIPVEAFEFFFLLFLGAVIMNISLDSLLFE